MPIRYKVLDSLRAIREHNKIVGYASFWVTSYLSLQYYEGQWTEAKKELVDLGYGITVFDTLASARDFAGDYSSHIIYEVEAKGKIKRGVRRSCLGAYDLEDFLHFEPIYGMAGQWPAGTEMYKRIKLLRKVG